MTAEAQLTPAQVGKIAGCHASTVKNYESRGYIEGFRDSNNFRRYTIGEANKLREILQVRKPSHQ